MPKSELKQVPVRLPAEDIKRLKMAAVQRDTSIQKILETYVTKYLDDYDREQAEAKGGK